MRGCSYVMYLAIDMPGVVFTVFDYCRNLAELIRMYHFQHDGDDLSRLGYVVRAGFVLVFRYQPVTLPCSVLVSSKQALQCESTC